MKILTILLILVVVTLISCNNKKKTTTIPTKEQNIYSFKVKTLNNETFDFATLKGKKILIVNTASKCGLTPQYKELQTLYNKYK
ncbi:MAG TPA: glutathione peroxidase, partial [Flavobacteriaceae bacterium]|nr:glutathione peroxidase [Flavobacteriaceae bacterium]